MRMKWPQEDKVWKRMKQVFHGVVTIIFYPVIAAALAILILYVAGIEPYITMSGSMEPAIQTGSVCFVNTRAEYEEIREGDIIAFRQSNGMVTHRVISITEEGMETKGDANDRSDGITTTRENFHGETLFSIPYMGYGLHALQQPAVLWIAAILLVAVVLWEVIDEE